MERIHPRPELDRLNYLLAYDRETGIFTWRVDRTCGHGRVVCPAGSVAGTFWPKHGITISIDNKQFKANILAWAMVTGKWPTGMVDHRDGDTLAVDRWGMKERVGDKIWFNDHIIIAGAGEWGQIRNWRATLDAATTMKLLLDVGYPHYKREENDPSIIVADRHTGAMWRHSQGSWMATSHPFMACGSGRDFALAAMHLGKSAREAVALAHHFDNDTGAEVLWQPI